MASLRNMLALSDPDPKEMTIVDHLEELRYRLVICILTVTVGATIGFFWLVGPVFHILQQPINKYHVELVVNKLTDGFVIELKVAVAIGITLGLPVLLYHTWMFIAPAITVDKRRYIVPFVLLGIVLFIIGIAVGYAVFPLVVRFLIGQTNNLKVTPLLTIGDYIQQFALVLVIFGAIFEMPVVLSFLALVGAVSSRFLRRQRRYAAMIGLIVAMIITPGADPITPFVTAGMVYLLYEFSIVMIRFMHR